MSPGQTSTALASVNAEGNPPNTYNLSVIGHVFNEGGRGFAVTLWRVDRKGFWLLGDDAPPLGTKIIMKLRGIDSDVAAQVSETYEQGREQGFVAMLTDTRQMRDIAGKVAEISRRTQHEAKRRHERESSEEAVAVEIVLADGTNCQGQVIDTSLSGAALTAPKQPPLLSIVRVGRFDGRVVRHTDGGFAVEFLSVLHHLAASG